MFAKARKTALACMLSGIASVSAVLAEPLKLYVDADYSISTSAAQSIELGIRTALSEVDYRLGGEDVEIVPMDHRANVKRSRRTLIHYLGDETALAVFGGLHSPPYLTHKEFINRSEILTLLPWSAAGPITRGSDSLENWIFRLSVDDSLSGGFLINQAVEVGGCQKMALILLETGWGRANFETLTAALRNREMKPVLVEFFSASIGLSTAHNLAHRVTASGADCGVLLSNWDDGARVLNALGETNSGIRIYSHWGIMGGQFVNRVDAETRSALQLRVLQTCGLRREREGNNVLISALHRAAPDVETLAELPAPTGFVHGYDLTRVLIQAAAEAAETDAWMTGTISQKRRALRDALEHVERPVHGILDEYHPPFRPFTPDALDAHEALGLKDLCIAQFRKNGLLEDAR